MSVRLHRSGIFASSIPVGLQPFIGARRSNGLLREPHVKVRQPCRRGPKRSLLMNVLNATIPTHAVRVARCAGYAQDPHSLRVVRGARRAPRCGQDFDDGMSEHFESLASIPSSSARRSALAPHAYLCPSGHSHTERGRGGSPTTRPVLRKGYP